MASGGGQFGIYLDDATQDWVAKVLNVIDGPEYIFAQGRASVLSFAESLTTNNQALIIDALPEIFSGEVDGETVFNELLVDCNFLEFQDIYQFAPETEAFADILLELGDWIITVLAFAARENKAKELSDFKQKILASIQPDLSNVKFGLSKGESAKDGSEKWNVGPVASRSSRGVVDSMKKSLGSVQPDFSMTWTNWSKDPIYLVKWECQLSAIAGTVIQQPSGTLMSSGQEGLAWYQLLFSLVSGNNYGYIIWQTKLGYKIGLKIVVPVQGGPIRVLQGNSDWQGYYTSDVYTFPTASGYNITVRPNAGHSNIFLSVSISNLKDENKS